MSFCERTVALIGQEKYDKLKTKNVIIFGCGGVGGYVIEMLARTGIEKITLVDFDVVSESNINRQIIATTETIGKLKTECFTERIAKINKNCDVLPIPQKLTSENINNFELEKYDYVIHAEMNALANACYNGCEVKDSDIYLTLSPCNHCILQLIQFGVKRVFYLTEYKDFKLTKKIAENSDIKLIKIGD